MPNPDGRALFAGPCEFQRGVVELEQLPPARLPELAFIGRSNVGKSSLINALTGRKGLARASNTPGRTQELNFFLLGNKLMLVDLPGYGYARAPKKLVDRWNELIRGYLRGRPNLRRVILLIDSRRGLMESDHEMMTLLDDAAVSYQCVLTKADKLSASQAEKMLAETLEGLKGHPAAYPECLLTSAEKGDGIAALRELLASFAG